MELKDLLSTLVSHDSVFGSEKSLAEWTTWYLSKLGFEVEKLPVDKNRFNVLAERGGSSKLLCYGHLDTVPVYQGWHSDPLSLTENGDKLYGLGTCDMKGGIAALLYAVQKISPDTPIKILLAVDEENNSDGAWTIAKKYPEQLSGVTHVLSGEPGASAHKIGGSNVITLGRRGRARFVIKIRGYSAHGGHVDRGINAIGIAAKVVSAVEALRPASHPHLGKGSQYIAKIGAAAEGLSIPEYCELEVERHLVLPETLQSCLDQYDKLCRDILNSLNVPEELQDFVKIEVSLKKRKNEYAESYVISEDDKLVKLTRKIMARARGSIINYGRSVGDENIFANRLGITPIIVGPEGANIHSPNEWVSRKSLQECADLYEQVITSFNVG